MQIALLYIMLWSLLCVVISDKFYLSIIFMGHYLIAYISISYFLMQVRLV